MDPQYWRDVRTLFDELVELPLHLRAERLAAIGVADVELHALVAALLDADAHAEDRLSDLDVAFLTPPADSPVSGRLDPLGLSGRTLAHFQILEALGSGGMGVVYRATDMRLNRAVALKLPLYPYWYDDSAKQRFLHEARSIAALDHPNLCGLFEVGESDEGYPFLAMPLYAGETLKERLAREGPLPASDAMEIARLVAEGLASAHAAGIVHRDVKPGNVMLLADGGVKVLDFGLAKARDLSLTGSRVHVGTVTYMAPEQVLGNPVDQRTDLWSLGVMLYEMLTGRRPFEGERDITVAHAIVHSEPVRPSSLREKIPRALEDIVLTLLQKEPRGRPGTARQVASQLTALQLGRRLPIRLALRQRWASAAVWRRNRYVRTSVLVAAVLVIAAGTILAIRPSRDSSEQMAPSEGTIAVLPFTNLSGDPEQEYLSEGITEELRINLRRVEGLRVAARTSTLRTWSINDDVREVGKALGVVYMLQGSVRRDGEQVRITANLIDASNRYNVWSGSYDGEIDRLFAVHDAISHAIVSALRIRLNGRPVARRQPTSSPEAYELYLKGRYFWNQRTEEALVRAAEYFRRAVEIDPDYAEAYSGLADVEVAPRAGRPSERFARAKEAASRALALDSTLAEAHASMAWIMMWYDRDWVGAERHFRKAFQLDPNYPWAHSWYSGYLTVTGRVEEGLAAMRRAHDLDPLSPPLATHVGSHYITLRREREAVPYFLKALEIAPDFYMAHWGLARVYLRQGRYEDALAELEYEGGDYVGFHRAGLLGYAQALAGNEAQARRILDDLYLKVHRAEYVPPVDLAIIHIALGEHEEALTWLEQIEADRGSRFIINDPIFDSVRFDPRFLRLRQRLGLDKELP